MEFTISPQRFLKLTLVAIQLTFLLLTVFALYHK